MYSTFDVLIAKAWQSRKQAINLGPCSYCPSLLRHECTPTVAPSLALQWRPQRQLLLHNEGRGGERQEKLRIAIRGDVHPCEALRHPIPVLRKEHSMAFRDRMMYFESFLECKET